jgi:ubiquinone/menaquinone biosynthesis C-methylase UbiE
VETPTRALDLGCGTGEWVRQAAEQWPECHVVGLDLVDKFSMDIRGRRTLDKLSNVTFILGNLYVLFLSAL